MSQIDLQWFAAEDEGKTEDPTETKLRRAREEGRVAKSQELNGSIVFLLAVILLTALAPWMERKCEEILVFYFNNVLIAHVDDRRLAYAFLKYFLMLVLPFCVIGIFAGVAANIIQNRGFIFSLKPIQPNFSKILPDFVRYFKETVFSRQGVFNLFKSLAKVAVLTGVAYAFIRNDLKDTLAMLHTGGPRLAIRQIGKMSSKILLVSAIILLVISIVDYFVQRRAFREKMKMTKQEVKEEFKELEGDPQVKGHLEQAQKQMLSQNMPRAVRESDVVITNPTHYAVALEYKENYEAPMVTAKGEDLTAQNIKRIAREAGVPTIENRPLARGLYAETEIGDIIPETYLKAIAVIYAQIGYMDKRQEKERERA